MSRGLRLALVAYACLTCLGTIHARQPTTRADHTKPLVTFAGAKSRIEEPTYLRVTASNEFRDLYLRHLGQEPPRREGSYDPDEYYNPHGVPVIDFDHCMVVAVFRGQSWNNAGVYVDSIAEDGARLIVRFRDRTFQVANLQEPVRDITEATEDEYPPNCTPYGLFVLPRSDKEVIVEQDVRRLMNAPAKWMERARFPALK